jgi:hypothetical protein
LPAESSNFLSVTGDTNNGDNDTYQVVFFEVSEDVVGPLYFAVYDPGVDNGASDADPDQGNTGNWDFRLIGGTNTLTGSGARNVVLTLGQATTGTQLGNSMTGTGDAANSDGTWVYFASVYPSDGEQIGNKRYFKVFATHSDGTKNGYQLDVSYTAGSNTWTDSTMTYAGTPTGVSSIRAFAYSWALALRDRGAASWDLYPFVSDNATGNITRHFWDFDGGESGTLYDKDETQVDTGLTGAGSFDQTSPYAVTGQTNGTWRLRLTENANDGLVVNTSTVWFTGDTPAENYRTYSAPYAPPESDHVTLSPTTASATESIPVTISIQTVDSSGNPVPYARTVRIIASSSGPGTPVINGVDADELITTSGDGVATFTINIADVASGTEVVTLTATTDGNNGSSRLPATGTLGTNGSSAVSFSDASDLAPTMTHAAHSFTQGTTSDLPTITLTETSDGAASNFTAVNGVRIKIPDTLNAVFSAQLPNVTGSGAARVGTLSFESSRVLLIPLNSDLADGETLILGASTALQLTTPNGPSSDRLVLSYSGSSGPYNVTASNTITVNAATSFTWDGGGGGSNWSTANNWNPDAVPDGSVNVLIGSGFTVVVDQAGYDVLNLTVASGATLQLAANSLAVNGTLSLDGTLEIGGAGIINGSASFDTNSGTVAYTDTNPHGLVQGNSYYNLAINGSGLYTLGADVTINGGFSIGAAGSLDASSRAINLYGSWTKNATGTFTASTSTVDFKGSSTATISGAITFNNLRSTVAGKRLLFTNGQIFTVSGDLTLNGSGTTKMEVWSTSSGSAFTFKKNPAGTQNLQYLSVRDSVVDDTSSVDLTASFSTSVSGNDDGAASPHWVFAAGGIYTWQGDDGTNPTFWEVGANWDLGSAPTNADSVIIPNVANKPRIAAATGTVSVINLSIYGNSNLTVTDQDLSISGTYSNDGTLILNGTSGTLSISQDTDTGTTQFSGAGTTLFGLTSFFHVDFNAGARVLSAPITVYGSLSISGGSLSAGANGIDVKGSWTSTAGTFTAGSGTVTFSGTSAHSLNSSSAFNNMTIINNSASGVTLTGVTTTVGDAG